MLPQPLYDIAVGQLLGDAHAEKSSPTSNTRLTWSFGSAFLTYAEYIRTCFRDYSKKGVYNVKVTRKKEGTVYTNYRVKTSLSVFNALYDLFYVTDLVTNKRIKIVPLSIDRLISPVVLAHLIMGDGYYSINDNFVRIYTNSFSYNDCCRLAQSITNLGVLTLVKKDRLGKDGKQQYFLKIEQSQLNKLRVMVKPHMHESMMYRIGL